MSRIRLIVGWLRPSLPETTAEVRASVDRTLADTALRLNVVVATLAPLTALSWVVLLWGHADHARLLGWLGMVTATSVMMLLVVVRYRGNRSRAEAAATELAAVLFVAGCAWGSLGALVVPDTDAWRSVIGMMLLSTLAVNAIFTASVPRMFWAFQLPVAGIGAVALIQQGGGVSRTVGFIVLYALPFSAVLAFINRGADERAAYYAAVNLETTAQLRELNARLAHEAAHDPLTGMANRQEFGRRLAEAVDEHPREVAVLFMDLDRFKEINDEFGHATGDAVIQLAARRILGRLRPHDILARLGGDEFTAVIPGAESPADVERIAERILEGFEEPFESGGREHRLGISIGIALPDEPTSAEALLQMADAALYDAKRAGRGRFETHGSGPDSSDALA
ncbi:MAG: GGDEF domain-containing protein [Acidimicrobiales bacterium]